MSAFRLFQLDPVSELDHLLILSLSNLAMRNLAYLILPYFDNLAILYIQRPLGCHWATVRLEAAGSEASAFEKNGEFVAQASHVWHDRGLSNLLATLEDSGSAKVC